MAQPMPEWKRIDEFEFKVSMLPGMRAVRVFTKLGNMIAGSAGTIGSLKKATGVEEQGLVLLGLLQGVQPDDVEYLARELLGPALVKMPDGKQAELLPVFDALFQGRTDLFFRVLVMALGVNYGSFFKGLSARFAAQAAEGSSLTSPSTSPSAGPAGA